MKKLKRKLMKQKKIKINENIDKDLIEKLKRLGKNPKIALKEVIKRIRRGAKNGKK